MPTSTLPPGPKGTLLRGNLDAFTTHRLDFFLRVARDYGDIARATPGQGPRSRACDTLPPEGDWRLCSAKTLPTTSPAACFPRAARTEGAS